jgi:hypothetical protein
MGSVKLNNEFINIKGGGGRQTMLTPQEMHKQELEVKEAETRAYQKVLDIIERMMDPEPFDTGIND